MRLVPVGITIIESPTGKITYVNDRAVELYGANPVGLEIPNHSTKIMKILKPNGETYLPEGLPTSRAMNGERIINDEAIIERNDGSRILVSMTAVPLKDQKGEIIGSVAIFEDITEKRELEKKVSLYTKHLEELVEQQIEQLKIAERFSAIGKTAGMVGHDIRNPLQTITGEVFLARGELKNLPESEEKQNLKESLDIIDQQASYVNKIVSDLQDLAKPLKPLVEETPVDQIVRSVLSTVKIPENIEVTYSVDENCPRLMVDSAYMRRILSNLILNAVQAMPNGGQLSIKAHAKNEKAIITVEDTGHGISDEIKEKIFTPLVTTKPHGQGFGLAVVKRLTEALNGEVKFDSQVGRGTQFMLELPVEDKR